MKIKYKKILGFSYMIIEKPEGEDFNDFQFRMLKNNNIPGLLKIDYETLDGNTEFLYDISSKYSFSRLFESEKISYSILKKMVFSLKSLSDALSEYLLDFSQVVMEPSTIFMDREKNGFYFCYLPIPGRDNRDEIHILFNELLTMIDYDDSRAVTLAFNLTKMVQGGDFHAADLYSALPAQAEMIGHSTPQDEISFEEIHEYPSKPQPARVPRTGTSKSGTSKSDASGASEFLYKAKSYFRGSSFTDIIDDINSGTIIKKIRKEESAPLLLADNPVAETYTPSFEVLHESSACEVFTLSDTLSLSRADLLSRKLSGSGSSSGISVDISGYPFTIGSSEKASFRRKSPGISRIHCRIYEIEPGCYEIEDENSTNGTYLNGVRLEAYTRTPLKCGDLIRLAKDEFYFR